jgi:two-component system, chemotaxis family, CheB/CheR fusion protein
MSDSSDNNTQRLPDADLATPAAAFPIVGIGASAGGLEACTQVLAHLPAGIGLALVLVQHLDPTHASLLPELLARVTPLPVQHVQDGTAVQPSHLYVVPPNVTMTIAGGALRLAPRLEVHGPHMPIDHFFRSLAADQGSRAIGIILSGTGSDGALGLQEIKERGGISFVQDEQTAKFAGMPHSAILHATVDFILPPEGIAQELRRIVQHPYLTACAGDAPVPPLPPPAPEDMGPILQLLRRATGVEFTHYKPSTISRRILRRMALRQLDSFGAYTADLRAHPEELDALYHDLLIKVTGFFRDPHAFDALTRDVLPRLLEARSQDTPIRIWVPGCATGEEAYSLAISVLECLGERAAHYPVRIFATDLDEGALAKARSGLYIENIELDVSPERLRRFFVKVDVHYQITHAIREMCTFARHDLCRDPPFSHVDLVSCRNVLIYLDAIMQRRIMPLFHYALHPGGFLMLGTAETLGSAADLFIPVDHQHKIYAKVANALRPPMDFTLQAPWGEGTDTSTRGTRRDDAPGRGVDVFTEADRVLLQAYGPTGVLINAQMDILQFRGDTSHYLRPAPGKASLNLLQMGREGLLIGLRAAMADAQRLGGPVSRAGVQIAYEGQTLSVTLRVLPLTHPSPPASHYMVLFDEAAPPAVHERPSRLPRWVRSWWGGGTRGRRREGIPPPGAGTPASSPLRDELEATKQYLQAAIEQREATNEELRAGSEEILSANEELQSTNEELETAKEELQSANEELTTVNEELRGRNVELAQAHDDLHNLFSSGHLPVVLLDRDLRIRRVTATAEQVLHIIPTDVGRPLTHLNLTIPLPEVKPWLVDVLDTGHSVEREVQDRAGHWYSLRIHPYRSAEHTIDGAVLVVIDIDSVKDVDWLTHLLVEAQAARQFAEAVVETVREPLVVLDSTWHVLTANAAFYRTFQVTKAATEGAGPLRAGPPPMGYPGVAGVARVHSLPEHGVPGVRGGP